MAVSLGSMFVNLSVNPAGLISGLSAASAKVTSFGGMTKMQAGIAGGAMIGVGVAAGAMTIKSVKSFSEFETGMANVSTLVDTSKVSMEEMGTAVREMAVEYGRSTTDMANGLYQIISATIPAEKSTMFLAKAAQTATAGVAGMDETVLVLTKTMAAYGIPAEKVGEVSDKLFTIVKRGQTTFAELANSFPRVATLAGQMGIGIDELGGTFATLTKLMASPEEAATSLSGVLTAFLKPTEDMTQAFADMASKGLLPVGLLSKETSKSIAASGDEIKRLDGLLKHGGITQSQYNKYSKEHKDNIRAATKELPLAAIKTIGLNSALELLKEHTGGSAAQMAEMIPRIRGLRGVLPLIGEASRTTSEDMAAMGESAGATEEAFAKQSDTIDFKSKQMKASWNELAITIGEVLVPAITPLIELIGTIASKFGALPKPIKMFIAIGLPVAAVVGTIAGVVLLLSVAFAGLNLAMLPVIGIVLGIMIVLTALIVAIIFVRKHWDEIWLSMKIMFGKFWNTIVNMMQSGVDAIMNLLSPVFDALIFLGMMEVKPKLNFTDWKVDVASMEADLAALKASKAETEVAGIVGGIQETIAGITGGGGTKVINQDININVPTLEEGAEEIKSSLERAG